MPKQTTQQGGRLAPWNDPSVRWVCENHPDKDFEHKIRHLLFFKRECGGAGMPEITEVNIKKGYVVPIKSNKK